MGAAEVSAFLTHLAVKRQVAASTQNQALAALLFLYYSAERGLADILKRLTSSYDKLFQVSFSYSMGFHQRPTDGRAHPMAFPRAFLSPAAAFSDDS
jgi:galactose-1-phosphate uridylyltransferase